MPPRVLFDTNIYVSFLLAGGGRRSVINDLFDLVSSGKIELVLPQAVLDELIETVFQNPWLTSRVHAEVIELFEGELRTLATVTPRRELTIVPIVRDPDDDYILAYAVDERADYLISGDRDLLALSDIIAPLKIRSPREFIDELGQSPPGSVN